MVLLDSYPYLLAPAIFFARVVDVSLGTFRSIVVFRGYPALAAGIGFIEVLIWVAAAGQVLRQVDAWPLMLAYAGGFACGNYIGVWLEAKVAIGRELIRVISHAEPGTLAPHPDRLASPGETQVGASPSEARRRVLFRVRLVARLAAVGR